MLDQPAVENPQHAPDEGAEERRPPAGESRNGHDRASDGDSRTRALILRAQDGDEAAWCQLDERYRKALWLLCRRRVPAPLRGRLGTEDLVNSTLMTAARELATFRDLGPGSFHAWIRRILQNKLRGKVRAHQADKRDARREQPLSESLESEPGSSPSDRAADAEALARLLQDIAALPEPGRSLIARCHLDGEPLARVAADLRLPETTARRLHEKCFAELVRRHREERSDGA